MPQMRISCMNPCGSMQPAVASVAAVVPEVQILASAISVITVPEQNVRGPILNDIKVASSQFTPTFSFKFYPTLIL